VRGALRKIPVLFYTRIAGGPAQQVYSLPLQNQDMLKMDKTKMAISVFDKRASDYQEKYMDLDLYNDTLDLFCDNIQAKNAGILDIACGPGNITRYLLKKRPDFKILGIDLAPNMIALASRNNPGAAFQLMDCREIGQIDKKFDGIICGFGLPYLSQEEAQKLIGDASALLKENGVLYLSTMEAECFTSELQSSEAGDQLFINYHQADYLTRAFTEMGLEMVAIKRQNFPTKDGTKITDLVLLARN
jgi:ubiquinone/menaquinone biosynthesis C-methylase UbiE